MSCQDVGAVLLVDDDTIRTWYRLFKSGGISGLADFDHKGSACRLRLDQQEQLSSWVNKTLPHTTRMVGAWIEQQFGLAYQSRSGLVRLLHRLGMVYRKPEHLSRKLDESKQQAFIQSYSDLLNSLPDDEVVMFADAVHPTHSSRSVGCWAPKDSKLALDQSNGRQRLNIHGAIDLETGQTRMFEVPRADAVSTIALLASIENLYPKMRRVHIFVDNAPYHHARMVRDWLAQPGRRIELHFIPTYCPHLNPIERLWGLMHRNITHNRCYDTFSSFSTSLLGFLRQDVPRHWDIWCDQVSDNFRVISPKDFRVLS